MSRKIPLNTECGLCFARNIYGKKPDHQSGCSTAGRSYDRDCKRCGHWIGKHTSSNECMYEGCNCTVSWVTNEDLKDAKPDKNNCDCGGAKLGYPPGILHSHWNKPKDKSKWCPMRIEQ